EKRSPLIVTFHFPRPGPSRHNFILYMILPHMTSAAARLDAEKTPFGADFTNFSPAADSCALRRTAKARGARRRLFSRARRASLCVILCITKGSSVPDGLQRADLHRAVRRRNAGQKPHHRGEGERRENQPDGNDGQLAARAHRAVAAHAQKAAQVKG